MEHVNSLAGSILAALSTYSNVHRGSGHYSVATTHLYEEARNIVLDYLDLDKEKYNVIFTSKYRADFITAGLDKCSYHKVTSSETGLNLGVVAIAVLRKVLPDGAPLQPGGGAARLVSPGWVVWAGAPDRFEAGTPAIINVIAFATALRIIKESGENPFAGLTSDLSYCMEIPDSLSGEALLTELRETFIGTDTVVPTINGESRYVNLDNAASTQTFGPVFNAFLKGVFMGEDEAVSMEQQVRNACSDFLNAPENDYRIVFTTNTTEAINVVAESIRLKEGPGTVVLNTFLEHNSNDLPWRSGEDSLVRLKVDHEGFIDITELRSVLESYNRNGEHGELRIGLVAVSGASNVLGTCNDLQQISSIVHDYGARILVDAAQLVAHRKTDVASCDPDYVVFSAHKAYAPFGTGVLVARRSLLNFSDEQLRRIEASGEENRGGIAALGKAIDLLNRIGMDVISKEESALTHYALTSLKAIEGIKIHGISDPESQALSSKTGVISFSIKGFWPDKISRELAYNGIGVRYGCHCAHMLIKQLLNVPPFLQSLQRLIAMMNSKLAFPGVVRISFSIINTREDIDKATAVLKNLAKGSKASHPEFPGLMSGFVASVSEKVYGNQHHS